MKVVACIFVLFLSACTHLEQPAFTYVLPDHPNNVGHQDTLQIPFYAPFNFIFDSSGNLFYYQQQRGILDCGTDYDYTTPAYIGLQPQHIIQLPEEAGIKDFLKTNVYSVVSDYRVVSIASLQDTIKAPALMLLMGSFSNSANHTRYYIRKATQEETVVLNHKLKGASYNVDNIAWDSSKIRFMPSLSYGESSDDK